jgi:porphobilinogen synthase
MAQLHYSINRRRLRVSEHVRELSAGIQLNHRAFLQPVFVDASIADRTALKHMPGVYAETVESLLRCMEEDIQSGVRKFLLFPVPAEKQEVPLQFDFVQGVLQQIRAEFGRDVWIAADACLCAYTSHGHCGLLDASGMKVDNHASVNCLANYALRLAQAGADCIAPSDMMDGRVSAIRDLLNTEGFDQVSILSYSTKFSSQWYGPFRDACHSSPAASALKDRKSYQLSPANAEDAILSAMRDAEEGADMLMVKPAGWYMDILLRIREQVNLPIAAYHVSGEYAALEQAVAIGLMDRAQAHMELWTGLKRAGADIIISYAARNARSWIEQQNF